MWLWHYTENPSRGFFDAQAHHPAITKAQVKHCDVVTAFSAHHLSGCFRKHCWPSDTNQRKHLWLSDILCITLPLNRHTHTHTLEELTFRIALQVGKISNRAYLHIADNVHTSFVWREWFLLSHWQACLFCPETPGTVKHPAVQLVLHLLLSQLAGWPPTSISLSPLFCVSHCLSTLLTPPATPPPCLFFLPLQISQTSLLQTTNFQIHSIWKHMTTNCNIPVWQVTRIWYAVLFLMSKTGLFVWPIEKSDKTTELNPIFARADVRSSNNNVHR